MSHCGWFPMRHEEIVAWVDHHRAELPTNLVELSRFPMRFRSVIANSVDSDQRVRFWAEHLQSFIGPNSRLSPEQQTFVTATLGELSQLLSARAPNPTMTDWESREARVFTRAEASQLFGMLGPPEPPEGLPLPPDAMPGQAM